MEVGVVGRVGLDFGGMAWTKKSLVQELSKIQQRLPPVEVIPQRFAQLACNSHY